jgi:hypothetical protein
VKDSATSVTSLSDGGDVTVADSLIQGSFEEASTEPKQPEHPKSLPPWLDIIVYWQHTKSEQPISPTWSIKSSIHPFSSVSSPLPLLSPTIRWCHIMVNNFQR